MIFLRTTTRPRYPSSGAGSDGSLSWAEVLENGVPRGWLLLRHCYANHPFGRDIEELVFGKYPELMRARK